MNRKNTIIILFTVVIVAFSFVVYKRHNTTIFKLKRDIKILKDLQHENQVLTQFFSYKSLPIEKLDRLDFIAKKNLESGKAEMQKHKVVFTGIARDNAQELPMVMRAIEYLGQSFKDYRVIIFENDSSDATKMILDLWKIINPKVEIVSKDFYNKKRPSIKFLADSRNQYLNVLKNKNYEDFDFVIAIDMDMKYGVDPRGIQDSFSKIERWDMVCSNGISNSEGKMYDGFAFRSSKLPYKPQDREDYWNKYMTNDVQLVYSPDADLVPVHSCFGGLAIYKRDFFEGCQYDSIEEDCEHIKFHECMRSKHKARIFMNPAQILRYIQYQ